MRKIKTSLIVTLTFFAALLVLNFWGIKADAAGRTAELGTKVVYSFVQQSHTNMMPIQANDAKIIKVKNTNPKVARVEIGGSGKSCSCYTPQAGTAEITYTLKENGKKYTLKQKVVVTDKYPFEKLEVNGKSLMKNLKNVHQMRVLHKKKKFTVSWKLKNGWKAKRVYNECSNKEVKTTSTKVNLKGKTFSAVSFIFEDKNGHTYQNYILPFWAKD
jgi:hypothetical protein